MRKKKISKEIGQKEKKSRAKYECPSALEKLIKIANLVPANISLQSIDSVLEKKNNRTYPKGLSGEQGRQLIYVNQ